MRTHITLLVLAASLCFCVGSNCPATYKRFSQKHTYCLPPKQSCNIQTRGVSAEEAKNILRYHNQYRSRIATGQESIGQQPSASNMLQMVWNDELAAVAQKHAEQCEFEHDCNECRQTEDFSVGQNLYTSWTDGKNPSVDWKKAVKGWYDEVKDFPTILVDSFQTGVTTEKIGHYTQMVWAESWQLGCGYTSYVVGRETHQLYTCNYGPAGNVKYQKMYKKGSACGDCPSNTCCGKSCGGGEEYPGLCKVDEGKSPHEKVNTKDYAYYCDFRNGPCSMETPGNMKQWKIHNTLSNSYAEIVLNGGESSVLKITKHIPAKSAMCFSLSYRKGANVAGQTANSVAKELIRYVKSGGNSEIELKRNTEQFMTFGLNLGYAFDTDLEFGLSFSVPSGAPPQYFSVTKIFAKPGKC